MKKNAFTLVELLGAIVILSVIALITVPLISNIVNDSQNDINNIQKTNYERAARDYVAEDLYNGKCKTGCELTIKELKDEGYLDAEDVNDKIDENASKVKVTYASNKYSYVVNIVNK